MQVIKVTIDGKKYILLNPENGADEADLKDMENSTIKKADKNFSVIGQSVENALIIESNLSNE